METEEETGSRTVMRVFCRVSRCAPTSIRNPSEQRDGFESARSMIERQCGKPREVS